MMNTHEEWLKQLNEFKTKIEIEHGLKMELPPPSLNELKLEYLEINPGKRILARLPFQERFTNPIGLYQGGFLGAGLDEVFGPLSYLTAKRPCMTLSMNVSYLKAFSAQYPHCLIEAQVLQKTQSLIFMKASVTSPAGDVLAHADSHVMIMRDDQLQKGRK
jgi:acyl-coenzyme A thioesterase PaaI-like protein